MTDPREFNRLADRIAGHLGPFSFITKDEKKTVIAALRTAAAESGAGAVKVKPLEWVEREGVTGTFDASTPVGHYIATITDDDRGMWFIVGQTMGAYMLPDIDVVKAAAQADYEARILSALTEPAKAGDAVLKSTIPTCCVTGAIPGDGGACGDCDPCLFGEASVPDAVKRLIAEKNSLLHRIGELEAGDAVLLREALAYAKVDIAAAITLVEHYTGGTAFGLRQTRDKIDAALSTAQPDTAAQGGKQSDGGVHTAPASCPNCFNEGDCANVDICNAVADVYRPSEPALAEPVPDAWVIPGDNTANDKGFIDAMAWEEGEFTKPLYAHPIAPAAPVSVDEVMSIICKAIEELGFVNHLPIKLVEHLARALLDAVKMERK